MVWKAEIVAIGCLSLPVVKGTQCYTNPLWYLTIYIHGVLSSQIYTRYSIVFVFTLKKGCFLHISSDSGSSALILNFRWQNLNGGNGTACTFTFSPRRFSRQLQTPTKYIFLESSLIGESIGWSFVHLTATLRCSFVKTGQNFRVPADR